MKRDTDLCDCDEAPDRFDAISVVKLRSCTAHLKCEVLLRRLNAVVEADGRDPEVFSIGTRVRWGALTATDWSLHSSVG